ncbi:MAG: AsmA family protein [Rhodospirillaceae bacterium]|nr:AsmA family protein [Rhodospirillaceae bacterium]
MQKGVKILGVIGVLVVALAVGLIVALKSIDFNQYKGEIVAQVKAQTGRDLQIAGDLDLSISLSPSLKVQGVKFANASWGTRPQMLLLENLEAQVNLLALLTGDIEVNYIVLSGLDIFLETDAKGRANWEISTQAPTDDDATTAAVPMPKVHDVRLENVRLTYKNGVQKSEFSVNIPNMNFGVADSSAPIQTTLQANLNGVDVDVSAKLGSLKQFENIATASFPARIEVKATGFKALLDGGLRITKGAINPDFTISTDVSDMATLAKLSGVALPPVSTLQLAANLKGSANKFSLSAIEAKIGDSDISGDVSINLATKRPSVEGKLASMLLDINQITGSNSAAPKKKTKPGDKVFSPDPLGFAALGLADVKLSYSAKKLKADVLSLEDFSTTVELKASRLKIDPLSLKIGTGSIKMRASVDGAVKKPKITVRLSARGVDAGKLLKEFGLGEVMTLKVDSEVDLKGAGISVKAIMANLSGSARIVGHEGRLNDKVIAAISTGFTDALPWASRADANAINCVVAHFPIKSGIATAKTLLFDTNGMTVSGSGNANLKTETLNLMLAPEAKNVSLGSFAVPFKLTGAFSQPSFGIDPTAAVVGTIGNVGSIVGSGAGTIGGLLGSTLGLGGDAKPSGDANPCIAALSGKTKATAPKPASKKTTTKSPVPVIEDTTKAIKNIGEDIGKGIGGAIKGIFGN